MSEKKTRERLMAPLLLIMLLSFGGSAALSQRALAEQSATPAFSPDQIQSWKDYLKNYPAALAQYQKEQEQARQSAKLVIASKEKDADELMKAYPFLQKDLQSAKDLQKKITDYMSQHPDPAQKQSIDAAPRIQVAEDKDSRTKINVFFVGKSGQIWCSPHGCSMDVYVDTGAGYQLAGQFMVPENIYLSRAGGNVFVFLTAPQDPKTIEWALKDGKFIQSVPPPAEPQSQAFVEWRMEQEKAGQWPPQ
jgi:hypothetical protein